MTARIDIFYDHIEDDIQLLLRRIPTPKKELSSRLLASNVRKLFPVNFKSAAPPTTSSQSQIFPRKFAVFKEILGSFQD
jgi:hypothetical protein